MPKYRSKFASWTGFILSLIFHASLFGAVIFAIKHDDDGANGYAADIITTNISMEMMMATVAEEAPPPEPEPAPEPEPVAKEEVADPTVKPEPPKPEKPKEEKKKEKPKEKPKPAPKEKPQPTVVQPHAVKADKTVISDASVNSRATTTGNVTSNNPNLTGGGAGTDEIKAYQSALRREIERHKKYSQRARMMRKQGVVRISFNVGGDGSISGARVAQSSGSEDLDNSALSAVQSARSVGPRPAGMPAALTVPISFTIQ